MALDDTLNSLGAFLCPTKEIEKVSAEYKIELRSVRNFLVASHAEVGLFSAGALAEIKWPVELPAQLLQIIKYKCNTITYTCGYHKRAVEPRSEYIFTFSSDCWKLREILGDEPFNPILHNPLKVRSAIAASSWELVPPTHDPKKLVLDLALLLWHAKAYVLAKPGSTDGEVESVSERLEKDLAVRGRLG